MNKLYLGGIEFEVIDTVEFITLADSFVKINKIGKGHGEAKLYIGNLNSRLLDFWEDFNGECFFLKSDFERFLEDSKSEYFIPQQDYIKGRREEKYTYLKEKINNLENGLLKLRIFRVDVAPPRVYINSNSEFYTLMREVGIPNISYVSVLKLRAKSKLYFYFKLFIDYRSDLVKLYLPKEKEQEDLIKQNDKLSKRVRETLILSRVGHGTYRKRLLEECMYCPITLVNDERILRASHLKPWADSDDNEKVDVKNGLILTPTYDTLLDKGFITFDNNKNMIVSPWISPMNQKKLNIYTGKSIPHLPLDKKRMKYLEYHRDIVFKR